jgi:SH3 domain protein
MDKRWIKLSIYLFASLGIILALIYAEVWAETMYVNEITKITVREGPGIEYKVISEVRTGQRIEIVRRGELWTWIRLADGREGFVLNRFLTSKKPNQLLLNELKKKYHKQKSTLIALREINKDQKDKKKRLFAELTDKKEKLKKLSKSYETLMVESTRFLNFKENYQETATQLAHQTKKAEKYEKALNQFRKRLIVKWALTGVGIFLVGFIIGMISNHKRRRSALL